LYVLAYCKNDIHIWDFELAQEYLLYRPTKKRSIHVVALNHERLKVRTTITRPNPL